MQATADSAAEIAAPSFATSTRAASLRRAVWLLTLPYLCGSAQAADEASPRPAADAPVAVEVFTGPKRRDLAPMYPAGQRLSGDEGWVQLNFMIDPEGKPYEIAVIDSTGDDAFERSAVQALERSTFEPARLGDKPIHAGHNLKFVFSLRGPATGAGAKFVKSYKRLLHAIEAGDRTQADAALAGLQVQNLYEDAFKNLAAFQYHYKWGTEQQQLVYLQRAIAEEDQPRYLPKQPFLMALNALFLLQVRAQDYAGATRTWEKLYDLDADGSSKRWQDTVEQMRKLRHDGRAYTVPGTIEKGTSWFYRLFKNRFQIKAQSGRVSEAKLRCDKTYVFFEIDPDLSYTIDDKYGNCELEVVGEHGTTFQLTQS